MAVAEARAAWRRTANYCFVQEDAKRAPKIACCQSSPSSKQIDCETTNAGDMPENIVGFMPFHMSPLYSNLPPDARWWLQLQPSYGYQTGSTYEHLNDLKGDMEILRAEIVSLRSEIGEVQPHDDQGNTCFDGNRNHESSFDLHCAVLADCRNKDPNVKNEKARAIHDKNAQQFIEHKDTKENSKLTDLDPFVCFRPEKHNLYCFEPESPFIAGDKNVPWWRTTDKDDLASLVAHKSLEYVANCDLPPPLKMHVRKYPQGHSASSDRDDMLASTQSGCFSSPIVHAHGSPTSESMHGRCRASSADYPQNGVNKPLSSGTTHKDLTELGQVPEGDLCKAQLLEALRHSQTRAREAEKVAKQACAENEHVIKLFFRQAAQLFAYKQWLQLLQLETLYYQVKTGEPPISPFFPLALPWIPQKSRKLRRRWQKSTMGKHVKRGQPRHDISKYAVALALGLGLVGAGLLLGWTVGWMLPI